MGTNRREFLRSLGLGLTAAAGTLAASAWAQPLRILGSGEARPEGMPVPGRVSPELQRFVGTVRIGAGKVHGPLQVFWLHGVPAAGLMVATLEEARESGDLVITERAQATVPELVVENRGKGHVLLLAGEILLGGKQNRVLTEDLLLPPLSGPRPIGVYCVEQGRWVQQSTGFETRGSFAAPGLRAKVLEKEGQGRVWAEVDRYARSVAAPSPTGSYQAIYDKAEVKAHLSDAERALDHRAAPGALGAAVFVADTLAGVDLFGDPALFARQWPKLLRAQAVEAYRRPSDPPADAGKLRARVERLLQVAGTVEGTLRTNAGVGHLFECRLDAHRGAALVFDGRVMHVAIL
jgi:ARG and Rhodanese-Phosphatase-superfamily-associated Protein domain